MPWYKLPHADMVMWFDQDMDLEQGKKPHVNHVEPEPEPEPKDRTERYEIKEPDGTVVTVEHNLETGETKIEEETEAT